MTLTIPITSTTPIAAIQRQFQDRFPYLNLNFFKVISTRNHPYSVKKFCNPAQSLGAELTLKNEGKITITGDMTVAKLMEKMNKEFGIQVQVFRKSANLWMEVALTTSWTLEQQNHHGQEISIQ